jgi:uncharacterized protein
MAASRFITTTSTLSCPHSGHVTLSTSNAKVKADGQFVMRASDGFTIAGCTFQISGAPHPCVSVRWDVHCEQHKSQGDWSLTQDSVGYCLDANHFPFEIAADSRQGRRASYERHVAQMVIQLLLTTPGERADLPEFGCGLRALIFTGNSDALAAMTEMLVRQALIRWLSDHLTVQRIEVTAEDSSLIVRVEYMLVVTRAAQSVEVLVD